MPAIEDITTRGETLAPLMLEIRRLIESLGLLTEQVGSGGDSIINININGNVDSEQSVRDLAERIGSFLTGQLAPGQ